ncbi:MAG: hypothetical protein QNK03_26290 [Myxococcota bacterium]|nr:hypothetical protein [Myxococcota bacterium]
MPATRDLSLALAAALLAAAPAAAGSAEADSDLRHRVAPAGTCAKLPPLQGCSGASCGASARPARSHFDPVDVASGPGETRQGIAPPSQDLFDGPGPCQSAGDVCGEPAVPQLADTPGVIEPPVVPVPPPGVSLP